MAGICFNYLFLISTGSAIILFIFSIMAFFNIEGLKIKSGKYIISGIMLLINSLFYTAIAVFLKIKMNKDYQLALERKNKFHSSASLELPILKVHE